MEYSNTFWMFRLQKKYKIHKFVLYLIILYFVLLTPLYLVMSRYKSVLGTLPNKHAYGFNPRIIKLIRESPVPTKRPIKTNNIYIFSVIYFYTDHKMIFII